MTNWNNFFLATSGAAAALTGLIFVGVSISLAKILSIAHLPDRALLSLILLLNIMITSVLFLIPNQTINANGFEVLTTGLLTWIIVSHLDRSSFRSKELKFRKKYLFNMIIDQVALLSYIICGILILLNIETGLYWIVPAIIFSFIKAVMDAWVLLVEINR